MIRMALPPRTNRHSPLMRPSGWTSRRRAPSSGDVSFASRYVERTSRGVDLPLRRRIEGPVHDVAALASNRKERYVRIV
jgi:hypothetical protein